MTQLHSAEHPPGSFVLLVTSVSGDGSGFSVNCNSMLSSATAVAYWPPHALSEGAESIAENSIRDARTPQPREILVIP